MTHEPPTDEHQGLGPPRFGLSTMLGTIAAFCIVLASYTWFGASGALVFGLFALAVLAHVTGNWLGTQLRDIGNQHHRQQREEASSHALQQKYAIEKHHFAPSTPLRDHWQMSWLAKLGVLVGALLFGVGGAALIALADGKPMTWASFGLAAVAFAVLGAIGLFLGVCFVQAGWNAITAASKHR